MSRFDELFAAAAAARANAYDKYSGFAVGAAVLGKDGKIYSGCNVENASFPEGWCAETTALGKMICSGEREVAEVLVMADAALCTPCGGCRQRLAEFALDEVVVHICDLSGLRKNYTIGELLPARFVLEAGESASA
ncbi:cytidine deaminase [Stappia indica]|uniref:cytidine deaminase n=1 Tax=Stappia indica TaxID=538381 RepID=UPI001CD5E663|nr:cytidine deaminase [Stappia indica]MCA1299245.1 cytidine deaminase [Stappia indica]